MTQRRVRIVRDEFVHNPRGDMDWVGEIVSFDRRYAGVSDSCMWSVHPWDWLESVAHEADADVSDMWRRTDLTDASAEYYEEIEPGGILPIEVYWQRVSKALQEKAVVLDLGYNPSKGEILVTNAPFVWDTSDVNTRFDVDPDFGFIYVTKERAMIEYGLETWDEDAVDKVVRHLRKEIEILNQWIQGDVFGFICETLPDGDPDCDDPWEEQDSCFGFFGEDVDTNGMREHWPEEFQNAEIVRED